MRIHSLNQLRKTLNKEKRLLISEKKEHKYIRGGHLVVRRQRNGLTFTEKTGGHEIGISQNRAKVAQLARKRYLSSSIKQRTVFCDNLQKALTHIETFIGEGAINSQLFNSYYDYNYPELRYAVFSPPVLEWLSKPCQSNTLYPEALKFETKSGIMVRSKSEVFIANKLTEYGLPFKYEAAVHVNDETFYPDFTVLRWDGRLVLWEHFGMMDVESYAHNAAYKIASYQEAGYRTHTNLICTYEKDIENPQVLDDIIERFLI